MNMQSLLGLVPRFVTKHYIVTASRTDDDCIVQRADLIKPGTPIVMGATYYRMKYFTFLGFQTNGKMYIRFPNTNFFRRL